MVAIIGLVLGTLLGYGVSSTHPNLHEPPQQTQALNVKSLPPSAGLATKDVMQPAQGLDLAQERCTKYAGDETAEAACVLFHAGVITKDITNKKAPYRLNTDLVYPIVQDSKRPPGMVYECESEMVILRNGDIGWKETPRCRYK